MKSISNMKTSSNMKMARNIKTTSIIKLRGGLIIKKRSILDIFEFENILMAEDPPD